MTTLPFPDVADYYVRVQIQTAPKAGAVCMLHEKCVRFIAAALDTGSGRSGFLIKSQNILSQLQRSLVVGDAVSQSLFYLYDYCYVLLEDGTDTNLKNAAGILAVLRDTFIFLARGPKLRM
jgi:flagellin-specific chaperone FliS